MNHLSHKLSQLITEHPNPRTDHIDQLDSIEIMKLINDEDQLIARVIRPLIPHIAKVADCIVETFEHGGRLFYVGAGTSGRIGILDASECPPTYGTDPSLIQGLIAGGFEAVRTPVEGAEDSEQGGREDMQSHQVGPHDVVIGIAASGRTPYVLGAMKEARTLGALVVGLCNNPNSAMKPLADYIIEAVTGPEVIMGSTRMKSGSAQKLILNMLTTTAMIRSGKVYRNLMIDLNPSNEKLVDRAKRIIKLATGASEEQIKDAYIESDGHVKTAIVMIMTGSDASSARKLLASSKGYVRKAIDSTPTS
ncbi:N-acetylmuramic acid 6-phosphate etherase [Paenibacillus urinalis]|uniref:N-acetylmuramic acid 6-phosphate etherase n=1 Tax=Paenibacillus urinalis TaxID=521520 RepID=A0AAX3N0U2_9BACL|nr:N-acetylmuramic acid 6-phosphate etherase [Paenibacillus urinalis]WDH82928.1 N-acetylmuramic acid 6-phosphate etherase [Paenibacillus urinalis]